MPSPRFEAQPSATQKAANVQPRKFSRVGSSTLNIQHPIQKRNLRDPRDSRLQDRQATRQLLSLRAPVNQQTEEDEEKRAAREFCFFDPNVSQRYSP